MLHEDNSIPTEVRQHCDHNSYH
ncbi:rCG46813 [Rattus norvegicus]|uniref:RCG46813 n=1 Tax=Rattus norvegicus TaxID=10116 RepID=A6IWX6_RAT|nr:rCG46813 [Rattus norvegicus]